MNDAWNVPVTVENIPWRECRGRARGKIGPRRQHILLGANGAMRRHDGNRRAAEQRDELASLHSITLSARSTSPAGTSCPIVFAALRLMTSSNRVGCSTGR